MTTILVTVGLYLFIGFGSFCIEWTGNKYMKVGDFLLTVSLWPLLMVITMCMFIKENW